MHDGIIQHKLRQKLEHLKVAPGIRRSNDINSGFEPNWCTFALICHYSLFVLSFFCVLLPLWLLQWSGVQVICRNVWERSYWEYWGEELEDWLCHCCRCRWKWWHPSGAVAPGYPRSWWGRSRSFHAASPRTSCRRSYWSGWWYRLPWSLAHLHSRGRNRTVHDSRVGP